jgi:glyoxylase-like metal-dependent hydrolase (beta-lactamase superfamily II)
VPDLALEDGDMVETSALGPMQVVFTPGHAPGHVCLHSSSARVFVSGDHVLPKISPAIAWMEERDALADYKESLARAARLDTELVIPSHGDPFPDLAGRAAEIWRHHEERCEAIRAAVSAGARTAHDVVGVLWPKVLSPFNYRFGIYEVMAHVKFMDMTL